MINKNWYDNLKKSKLTPPNYIFGIIWPFLYLLMIASLLIILNKCKNCPLTIIVFIMQLLFNLVWTTIFFKEKNIKFALIDLVLTLIFSLITAMLFFRVSIIAGLLLIPYILWLFMAFYLNLFIYTNNKNYTTP